MNTRNDVTTGSITPEAEVLKSRAALEADPGSDQRDGRDGLA